MKRCLLRHSVVLGVLLLGTAGSSGAAMDAMKTDGAPSGMKHEGAMMDKPMGLTRSGPLEGLQGHGARGLATLRISDGAGVLVLSDIAVDKVPDGHVILATDGEHRQGIDLGILRQFSGTVTLTVPAGVDLSRINSVVIWCQQYNVGIGRADLHP